MRGLPDVQEIRVRPQPQPGAGRVSNLPKSPIPSHSPGRSVNTRILTDDRKCWTSERNGGVLMRRNERTKEAAAGEHFAECRERLFLCLRITSYIVNTQIWHTTQMLLKNIMSHCRLSLFITLLPPRAVRLPARSRRSTGGESFDHGRIFRCTERGCLRTERGTGNR